MRLSKEDRFIYTVENFLPKEDLIDLQLIMNNLELKYLNRQDGSNIHFGFGSHIKAEKIQNGNFLKRVKQVFYPNDNLKAIECRAHLRHNFKEPLPHVDANQFAFLLYVKGEPLFNNGTGFYNEEGNLYHHIGFVENTAIFFNASEIKHSTLQAFGKSSPRYCINIFYKAKNAE
tara:strand:- start:131 stop:652 length:522 start_codon:yes stop_codon:yes gene_type:complete